MMRLFVGLAVPSEVRAELARLCCGLPGARWIPADNFHLTLRFIGEVPAHVAEDVDDALARVMAPAFELAIDGVGHFGKDSRARTAFAGIAPSEGLMRLQAKVESAVVRAGLPPESRKFHPHVTLARLKGAGAHALSAYEAEHGQLRAGPWNVDAFTLFRSRMGKGGSVYEALADYPLAGGAPGPEAWEPDAIAG